VTFNPIRWLERYVEWWDDRGRQNAAGPTPMHIYWMWVSWSVCAVVLITTLGGGSTLTCSALSTCSC